MTHKTAYLWGPVSSFSGPLAAWLVTKGWHVQVATKSALNLLSLSPLDLHSSARALLEQAMGGRDRFRTFKDRLRLVDEAEGLKGTKYDAIIFCGLPPNFDEPRAPRAPWAAARLPAISKALKGVPVFIVSSLWGGIQNDRVVPEEFEFQRRKALNHWESLCQQYELKLLDGLSALESHWNLVRIPMISGSSATGETPSFTGPMTLFKELAVHASTRQGSNVRLAYNPDSTLWYLPVDIVVHMFWRYLEDEQRPRICNLVSTQATLNREWLHHLGKVLKVHDIVESEHDQLNLNQVLRKMLLDDVQVRSRNLFEVAGRYNFPPVKLDEEYFQRLLARGIEGRWGTPDLGKGKSSLGFSDRLAQYYFEEFIPSKFAEKLLKKGIISGTSIGFLLKGANGLGWVLTAPNGTATMERFDPNDKRPRVCFHFTGRILNEILHSKLPLHRALLLREVQVEGPLLDAMRASSVIEKFLKEYQIEASELSSLATEQTVSDPQS